jgi:gas vesicle protein
MALDWYLEIPNLRRLLSSLVALAAGLCIGGVIGYATALLKAGTNSVLLAPPGADKFARVYSDMGKLSAAEILASNCKGVSDVTSVLANEDDLIRNLRKDLNEHELTPTIDVAEGRLAIRIAASLESVKDPKLHSEQKDRAEKLLGKAGWRDPSAGRMRQIVLALDEEQCQRPHSHGVQTR